MAELYLLVEDHEQGHQIVWLGVHSTVVLAGVAKDTRRRVAALDCRCFHRALRRKRLKRLPRLESAWERLNPAIGRCLGTSRLGRAASCLADWYSGGRTVISPNRLFESCGVDRNIVCLGTKFAQFW